MPYYPQTIVKEINYKSPSGRVYIGKYQPPFEKVINGFGFIGIILEDVKTNQLQCCICGKWFENLSSHISLYHKINIEDYKDNFGLSQSTALQSKKMRLMHSEVMTELRKNNPQNNFCFSKNNLVSGNRKNKPKSKETKNKYGVCDLQILEKISSLKKELNKTPSLVELKERYGGGFVNLLNQRYGSYIHYCRQNGFKPLFSKDNPKYSKKYFIDKAKSWNIGLDFGIKDFSINESRALYKYYKGGIKELKKEVK